MSKFHELGIRRKCAFSANHSFRFATAKIQNYSDIARKKKPPQRKSLRRQRDLSVRKGLLYVPQQLFCLHLHLAEGKPLPAEVFQGGTNMVDGAIDAEETVVDFVKLFHLDGLVLGVMFCKVERELLLDFLCVDGGRDFLPSFVEHRQHGVVHIVIEQHDAFLGRA